MHSEQDYVAFHQDLGQRVEENIKERWKFLTSENKGEEPAVGKKLSPLIQTNQKLPPCCHPLLRGKRVRILGEAGICWSYLFPCSQRSGRTGLPDTCIYTCQVYMRREDT
ncbi:hypothetical protein KIL84_013681 [Mauremys mutica]|uniref:Uncharacterized protein n=1 Tax=Mauremys mutica TaxID=74926 RepID=A0A9D3WXR2_9SAUR|nr:hypothetical protein KIL84_013681 [Mauremys mutica]